MDSRTLRKETLSRRDSLSISEQQSHSARIMERVVNLQQFKSASIICMYVDFRSEVKTRPLIQHILQAGKTLVLPVTLVREKDLLVVSITDPENELAPGYCSIPEPIVAIREKQVVSPDTLDMIFLPGSVFDEQGGRMGYGGGYYDRFVSMKAPQAYRVGLCYELQMVQQAPLQAHDEGMDCIVTEENIRLVPHSRPY